MTNNSEILTKKAILSHWSKLVQVDALCSRTSGVLDSQDLQSRSGLVLVISLLTIKEAAPVYMAAVGSVLPRFAWSKSDRLRSARY